MNESLCKQMYANFTQESAHCPAVFDNYLCWPPTAAGNNHTQSCPNVKGLNPLSNASRICTTNGTWFDNNNAQLVDKGYTNFNQCFNPLLQELIRVCSPIGINECMEIVGITRKIEMIGYSLSLITLIISLVIFYKYRVLRNNRTTIHKNLFIATALQIIVRLVIYIDQEVKSIEDIKILCESSYVLLEFSKTATIMWMFIEGLSLHNAMTITVFQEYSFIKAYCYIGWIVPQLLTTVWLVTMIYTDTDKCWYLYNFLPNYWILEGPTSALIIINMLFLLNIIRILVMKLRVSHMGEIEQIRKAVRAAILLVPLMGTVNVLFMIDYRSLDTYWEFATWSFTTYFLTSFQGFFIATLYCFMNGEVREVIKNNFSLYMSLRHGQSVHVHRHNFSEVTGLSAIETPECPSVNLDDCGVAFVEEPDSFTGRLFDKGPPIWNCSSTPSTPDPK